MYGEPKKRARLPACPEEEGLSICAYLRPSAGKSLFFFRGFRAFRG
jgi:hypothetical protein